MRSSAIAVDSADRKVASPGAGETLGNADAGPSFDDGVGVYQRPAEASGQDAARQWTSRRPSCPRAARTPARLVTCWLSTSRLATSWSGQAQCRKWER